MKKFIPLILGFLIGCLPVLSAEGTQNDTTVHFNKKLIQVQDSVGQVKIKVFDTDSVPYKSVYEGIFSDGKSYEKWTVMEELGIQLPFLNNKYRKSHHNYSMKAHWSGIGWGFANIADRNNNINNINGISLKSESTNEFFINLFEKILPVYRNVIGLTTGVGFDWHNYYLDMNTHLLEVDGVTNIYPAPAGVNYEYSRLRTFHITVPLFLEWQPTFGKNHEFFVTGGVIGGVNTFADYKINYVDANGNTVTKVESNGLNTAPLSLDFCGQIGYGCLNVYAKYSPFSIFQSGKGPDVRAVSLGMVLNF